MGKKGGDCFPPFGWRAQVEITESTDMLLLICRSFRYRFFGFALAISGDGQQVRNCNFGDGQQVNSCHLGDGQQVNSCHFVDMRWVNSCHIVKTFVRCDTGFSGSLLPLRADRGMGNLFHCCNMLRIGKSEFCFTAAVLLLCCCAAIILLLFCCCFCVRGVFSYRSPLLFWGDPLVICSFFALLDELLGYRHSNRLP